MDRNGQKSGNKKDADECADLVVKKIKQATSPSVWWFEKNKEELPKVGDIAIVTDWNGNPKAIIRTTKVEIVNIKILHLNMLNLKVKLIKL